MAIHHIIPRHEWLKRFGNLLGFNKPDNKVNLSTAQHAEVHLHYFNEITHIEYDRVASLAITKQIGKEDAQRLAASIANRKRKHSVECSKNHSKFMQGNKNALGYRHTSQWKKDQSLRKKDLLRGYKHPLEFGMAISARMRGVAQLKVQCPYCLKVGTSGPMHLWHFDNCKVK